MAEQNIWKKQAMMNRMKASQNKPQSPKTNTNSPINQLNRNPGSQSPAWGKGNASTTNNQAPWAKNNNTNNTPESTSVNLPWNKNNNPSTNSNAGMPKNQTKNLAPWAKNTNNQAPWANKNNNNPGTSKPPQTATQPPPWSKNKQTSSNESKSQQKIQINPPHPWNHKPEVSSPLNTSGNPPPWIKNDNSNPSSLVRKNSWKMKQSQEIQKQKEELQKQIEQQEEEEKQKKRIKIENKRKQEEELQIRRELQNMAKEDQYSKQRQTFQKEQEERIRRQKEEQEERRIREEQEKIREEEDRRLKEAEQRKRQQEEEHNQKQRKSQQEQKRLKKSIEENDRKEKEKQIQQKQKSRKGKRKRRQQPQPLQTSKISHISSIKGFDNINASNQSAPSIPQNTYHKYLKLINDEMMQSDYKKKIEIQKNIYQLQLQCANECKAQLISLFQSKKVTNRKRKFIYSNSMQIQYGMAEGRHTQSGIQFINTQIQQLRTIFLQYELLTKCVFSLMKKKINVHLRIPLLSYAQYKGVSFLTQHVCQELTDIIQIEINLFQQISNEVLILEKELELNRQVYPQLRDISKDQLMVKKISIFGQDYYILYIKNDSAKKKRKEDKKKYTPSPKLQNINDLHILEYIIGHHSILPYYQLPINVTHSLYQQMEKVSSPAHRNILHSLSLARAINLVYCSCQGQVNQQSFYQLVIQGNKQIWDMIASSGSPDRNIPKPIVLSILQRFASVKFKFSPKMFTKKSKELMNKVKPSVFIQRHDYELLQFIKNLQRYITQDKQELVEQSLALSRQLWQQTKEKEDFNFLRLKSEVTYLLYKQKENQAIELIEEAKKYLNDLSLQKIPLALLALKIYVSKDMEIPMLKTLSEMLPVLQFYFGQESMIHAIVYTAIGNYYSKKIDQDEQMRPKKVLPFYQHALNIGLKLYGEKALQIADIYLSRASAFANLKNYQLFHKDIQQGLKIYKMHSKSAPKIAQCNHLIGRVKCLQGSILQGVELMQQSANQFMKMYNYMESLCIYFQILPFLENKQTQLENKIQKIVQICFTYKSIWAFKYISTIVLDRQLNCYTSLTIRNLQELFHPLDNDSRTHQEVLIDLEEQIKGFTSFIEIVRWALSIIAGKLSARRQATSDYEKAHLIVGEIFHFYGKNQGMTMDLKDSQSQLL